jgi:hypothetical protein
MLRESIEVVKRTVSRRCKSIPWDIMRSPASYQALEWQHEIHLQQTMYV